MSEISTPKADGFRMPPEWAPHQCCIMAWPTRRSFWAELFEQAKSDYAETARAIAVFEPVIMICCHDDATEVRNRCGSYVDIVEIEIDDSWTRDSGPIFVANDLGELAVVNFKFNSWGGKYHPYDRDAALAKALADVLGARCYDAPIVLEGGAFPVDGEGTFITTELPIFDPNRNPDLAKEQFERVVGDYLGVEKVVWLVAYPDRDTDGHIDGIAQYVRPGTLLLLAPDDSLDENFTFAEENLRRVNTASDARDRPIEVLPFGITGAGKVGRHTVGVAYLNCYLANGAVIMPLVGAPSDELALGRLREVFSDRVVVGVPGATLSYGGWAALHHPTDASRSYTRKVYGTVMDLEMTESSANCELRTTTAPDFPTMVLRYCRGFPPTL